MRRFAGHMRNVVALAVACVAGIVAMAEAQNVGTNDRETLPSGAIRSIVKYTVPEIRLVRADGKTVALSDELNDGRPVLISFIFTTCTTICPLSSQTFQQLQSLLGKDQSRVHMVSISIDPEEDTPARLAAYARRYNAGPGWSFYTGAVQASLAAQRAFDAYRGDKMNHTPLTLFRPAPGKPWIRIDGFATAEDLYREILHDTSPAAK